MSINAAQINNLPHALTPVSVAVKNVTVTSTASTLETLGSFTFDISMRYVLATVEAATVRVDTSGGTPTTTVGQPLYPGVPVYLSRAEALNGKWILATATTANIQLTQYR